MVDIHEGLLRIRMEWTRRPCPLAPPAHKPDPHSSSHVRQENGGKDVSAIHQPQLSGASAKEDTIIYRDVDRVSDMVTFIGSMDILVGAIDRSVHLPGRKEIVV